MVMMISETTGAPRAGSIASLLSATPTPAVTMMAMSAASGRLSATESPLRMVMIGRIWAMLSRWMVV